MCLITKGEGMIFSRKLVQYVDYKQYERKTIIIDPSTETAYMLEGEIQGRIEDLKGLKVDSVEYARATEAIHNLCEASEKHSRNSVEKQKINLQIAEANRRRAIDWGQATPKIIGIIAYGCITCVILCLERQTPLSMRWLKAMEVLIAPKL